MKTQEAATNALVKLSDELKNAPADEFSSSDYRIAWLHSTAFYEKSSNLIRTIEFVDNIRVRLDMVRMNSTDDEIQKLYPLHIAVDETLSDLYKFADEMRTEFDEIGSDRRL